MYVYVHCIRDIIQGQRLRIISSIHPQKCNLIFLYLPTMQTMSYWEFYIGLSKYGSHGNSIHSYVDATISRNQNTNISMRYLYYQLKNKSAVCNTHRYVHGLHDSTQLHNTQLHTYDTEKIGVCCHFLL